MAWINEFRNRLDRFESSVPSVGDEIPISIKIRIDSGCYSRGCCPAAYRIIDRKLSDLRKDSERFEFEEHETGPEILVYLAVTAAGLGLAKSIIELVTTIIKARTEGRKKGDRHDDPITIIVRRLDSLDSGDSLLEERLITFHQNESVTDDLIEKIILDGSDKLVQAAVTKKRAASRKKTIRPKK
ncbi:MAG: hypothetical protein HY961_03085 [Ignavibacteriae bacterium]|nr:hypothetical protein [Ignavibacteriota bacterium]